MRPLTTQIVCVAENERRAGIAARTCDADRTIVIPNAVDASSAPRSPLAGEPPHVVSVGRLKDPKDFVTLMDALTRVERPYRASIAGDGPDRQAVEEHAPAAVTLLGDHDDVPGLLADGDVFVLSSRSEGMPMSILEAMAAGLPVVASRVGGVPELVVDGETGILVDPGDAGALARALERLLGDPGLRQRLGSAGRERVDREFDVAAFRNAHVRLYESLLP